MPRALTAISGGAVFSVDAGGSQLQLIGLMDSIRTCQRPAGGHGGLH